MFFQLIRRNLAKLIVFTIAFAFSQAFAHSPEKFENFFQGQQSNNQTILAANDVVDTDQLPTAVVWYLEMAEQGDKDAQYNLGSIFETGFGVKVDLKQAVKWYTKAAKQGHQISQLKLGMMYHLGKGVEKSTIKGNKWIRDAAKSNNSLALLLQEEVIAHDVEKDIDSVKLITKTLSAFEKGQINAEETLRLELQKIERARRNQEEKPRFAGTVTGSGAKEGTVKNRIPDFLSQNPQTLGPAEDDLSFIRRSAKDGDAKSQYKYARIFELGKEVDENLEEAFKWYTASAAQGHTEAQYRLGLAYLYGLGTQQSTAQAGIWLKKAREKMHPATTLLLNYISSRQNGVIDKAHSVLLSWYIERSVDGDGEAMMGLGHMFEFGWGIEQDISVAKRWYAKARAAGFKGASRRLRLIKAGAAGEPDTDSTSRDSQSNRQAATNKGENVPHNSTQDSAEKGLNSALDSPIMGQIKNYATPVILLVLGIFMGLIVFRWMRGGTHHDSVF